MRKAADKYGFKFLSVGMVLFVIAAAGIKWYVPDHFGVFCLAYFMSLLFVGSNFLVMRKIDLKNQNRFFKIFGWTLAARFALVIIAFVLIFRSINYQQFFFTVSFIISYICHSVTEVIFFNKVLEIDTDS